MFGNTIEDARAITVPSQAQPNPFLTSLPNPWGKQQNQNTEIGWRNTHTQGVLQKGILGGGTFRNVGRGHRFYTEMER